MARERRGRSLAEDLYDQLRTDILFGRRLPSSRLPLNEIAEEQGDAELAVALLTQHLEATARHLEAVAPVVEGASPPVDA